MVTQTREALSFEAALLARLTPFQGYTTAIDHYLKPILEEARFRARESLERDPTYKQLIPYIVVRHMDALFCYRRGLASSEKRLTSLESVGLGGHIEITDDTLFDSSALAMYQRAAEREVTEEVLIGAPHTDRIIGLINDDSTDVGRVHLGVVHLWDIAAPNVVPRERKIAGAGFRHYKRLARRRSKLESWAQLAIELVASVGGHWTPPAFANPTETQKEVSI